MTSADITSAAEACGLKFHPLANIFPLIEGQEFKELVDSIKTNGLREPIVTYEHMILDGRNRARACEVAGVDPRFVPFEDDDPAAFVIDANLHRRHVTTEQKRELIAKVLKAQPASSDRLIANITNVSNKTVGVVRRELEEREEIPHFESRIDRKGRKQPFSRKKKTAKASGKLAPIADATLAAPNPIAAAWKKASAAQRRAFVQSHQTEITRSQEIGGPLDGQDQSVEGDAGENGGSAA